MFFLDFAVGLAKQPLRLVLDVLGELLSISVKCDGLVLENSRLRRAYTSFKWIATQRHGNGTGFCDGHMWRLARKVSKREGHALKFARHVHSIIEIIEIIEILAIIEIIKK